ncbi:MAG: alpha/beta fold hydrolase [Elusimicrobiota bacterium]|jgi:pimeloyl-ACP methyl ester carboxylesterase
MSLALLLSCFVACSVFAASPAPAGQAEPASANPAKPAAAKPSASKPASSKPAASKPARFEPAAAKPAGSKAQPSKAKGPPSKEELAAGIDTKVLVIKKEQKGRDRTVRLKTKDGWWIVFTYRPPVKRGPVAVLAHGYGSGRAEWLGLSADLHRKGWGTLAFDIRGHGDSATGPSGRADFNFIDGKEGWLDAAKDFDVVLEWLAGQKVPASRTCLVGASLGANLAAVAAAGHPRLACAALLSPGRDFRGVRLDESPSPRVRTLAAASPEDPYSYQTLVGFRARGGGRTLLEASRGHGVEMLRDADFSADLVKWLDAAVKR